MGRKKMVSVLAFVLLAGSLAAADKPVVGVWEITSDSPEGDQMRFTLTVREEGGKLAGNIVGGIGEFDLVDPKYESGTFTFKIKIDEQTYDVETKVSGTKMEGSWKGNNGQGVVKGNKQS